MSPKYNPNAIWQSKKKKFEYEAPEPMPPRSAPPKSVPPRPPEPAEEFDEGEPAKSHALVWFLVVFVVLVSGGILYFFLFKPPGGPNVSIGFTKPNQVLVGDPFPLTVSLSNYSSNILKSASLSITLPDNVSFVGQSPTQRTLEETLGDLDPASIKNVTSTLIVTGDPKSVKRVDVKLTYSTDAAAKTQFATNGGADLVVGDFAISVSVVPPGNVFSGQDFDTAVTYTNNTSDNFLNVKLALQYPPVFSFTRSSMSPASAGNNSWDLGTVPAMGSGTLTITGNVVGPQNATYQLIGGLKEEVMGETYALNEQTANLAISASPLSLTLTLNNTSDYVAQPGDTLTYVLSYANNSNTTFQNIALKAALTGEMFDFATLRTNGAFNSLTDTVTWSAANTPQLLTLAPGQSGSVNILVRAASSYPIRLLSDKNYWLKVNAQISSPTVPPDTAASSTVSAASIENKVGGNISIAAEGYWRDASSGILNSGPYPPIVNQATQYTIHWAIVNYATDAQNVTVSAYLQSGTACTGVIQSNMTTAPSCNAATGFVSWTIPTIPATTGIVGQPAEAVFQVANTPAVNQVGSAVTLLGPTTLQAADAFTSSTLTASAPAVTTDLPNDKTISPGQDRRVTQ